ncbi:MAG: SMC-Scp complex subunit ScpB [Candidatus Buchananbacteria bacterium RIFCSPHIGHO2_02_FULL_45_11b]|uniref:SMC-Scp complex subunit ScpB n=2 Tax=Candidatus Buchananiibacteriota TaxID=1817903 RepID=A0A1G1YJV8_9BACT|nr:MAG: SMC-Scp complex subunit ScpB [Candidatus Buchananbacteria bacterium RIFCSPHIGHO2_01_FULL_46_12]OGY51970.1 MAG: SMC-Scp complex subunit ScpB [Candidatus Buchananbacteria bacterium RIFCSPHIGHO2_02_FULL_45_11b]
MPTLKSQIESLLFITNQPFKIKKLADLTKADKKDVEAAVAELIAEYNQAGRGVQIQKIGEEVQMATASDNAKLVKDYIKEETTGELSRAALETLTVVAYRGPVSRAEIEQIRGVNCAVILRNLLMRGLIESREDKKKMQMIYNITFDFLKFLGISGQKELPDYEKLNSDESLEKILETSGKAA